MNTYYGTKQTMTQTWDKQGKRMPVTVVKTEAMVVTQVKDQKKDGYCALQIGFGGLRKVNKPMTNHLKKSLVKPRFLREIKIEDEDLKVGSEIKASDVLTVGDEVVVRGVSKGKGFAGVIKRWGFAGGPRTHGQSDRERAPGSIGQGTDPGRVHKGKKMPGRMGNQQHAIQSLQILKIDEKENTVWISGSLPGSVGSVIQITKVREGKFDGLFYDTPREQTKEAEVEKKTEKKDKKEVEEKTKTPKNDKKADNKDQAEKKNETTVKKEAKE